MQKRVKPCKINDPIRGEIILVSEYCERESDVKRYVVERLPSWK